MLLLARRRARRCAGPFARAAAADSARVASYWVCGGDKPLRPAPYFATVVHGRSRPSSAIVGLVRHPQRPERSGTSRAARWAERIDWSHDRRRRPRPPTGVASAVASIRIPNVGPSRTTAPSLELGYHIDHLAAVMFVMVTFIATLILSSRSAT